MRAGTLRQKGTLQRIVQTEATNAAGYETGGKANAPRTIAAPWYAEVTTSPRGVSALQEQKRTTVEVSRAFEIRFRTDVVAGMRLVLENHRVLIIHHVFDPTNRRQALWLLCSEEVPRG